jgi:hypothetical protein
VAALRALVHAEQPAPATVVEPVAFLAQPAPRFGEAAA